MEILVLPGRIFVEQSYDRQKINIVYQITLHSAPFKSSLYVNLRLRIESLNQLAQLGEHLRHVARELNSKY